ncbi:MAG: ribonuclease P protein component [Myxococcota bacterium]
MQKSGRKIRSPHLLLVVCRGADPESRVGWTVSRKVGGAVTRNRVKRWLREVVRAIPGPREGPWDLVLIPRPEAGDAGLLVLQAEVADLFARISR